MSSGEAFSSEHRILARSHSRESIVVVDAARAANLGSFSGGGKGWIFS